MSVQRKGGLMTIHIRKCPGCREERSVEEVLCGGCGWNLTQEPLRLAWASRSHSSNPLPHPISIRHCLNGHPLDPGMMKCVLAAEQLLL